MTILECTAAVLVVLLVVVITARGLLTHRRVQAAVNRVLRSHRG